MIIVYFWNTDAELAFAAILGATAEYAVKLRKVFNRDSAELLSRRSITYTRRGQNWHEWSAVVGFHK
jgi:hypothetical protein